MDSVPSSSALPWEHDIHELYADKEAWQEGVHLEFKKSQSKLSDDLWETYSAFANTEGGIIILGVKDNGTVQGVENVPQQMKNLTTSLNNIEKVSCNVSLAPGMVETIELDGKHLIVIRVPKAAPSQKPVYINGNMAKTYFRQNESDILCRGEMLQQMFRDRSRESATGRLVPYTTWACIDKASWQGYKNRMQSFRPGHAWLELEDKELLEKLGGYTFDEATKQEGLTLAGLLMFGTDDAIRKFFPNYQVNFYEYDGREQQDMNRRWADRIYPDGTWAGNLYQFFFRVLPRLTESLKRPFEMNPDLSAKGETLAHKAVREAFANAIVHADYLGDGGIIIRKYPERLVLINPGTLLVAKDRLLRGGSSVCRNINLQNMFLCMGMVEKTGSGVDTILKGWLEECLMPPQVNEEHYPAQVVWELPFIGIIPQAEADKLKAQVGPERFKALSLPKQQILLVVYAKKEASHQDIHELLPMIHPSDLTKWLGELEAVGCLQSEGRTRAKVYRLPEKQKAHLDDVVAAATDTLTPFERLVRDLKLSDAEIGLLRRYHATKRNAPHVTDEVIMSVCKGRWVTSAQLALLMERNPKTLWTKAIQPLVRHKKLGRRYEDNRRSGQMYMTQELL